MAGKIVKTVISTANAPAAIGPYSQAVRAGPTLYISGQIGLIPSTMEMVEGGVEHQARQVLRNMGAILEKAGGNFENVVKTTVLLADMNDFATVNKVYSEFFSSSLPARAAYQVAALPKAARVEIEAVAVFDTA